MFSSLFSSLSRPKPSLRSQFSLTFTKAFFLFTLAILSLLVARPALAQSSSNWYAVPCDAQGNALSYPYQDAQQFYVMNGTEHWTLSNSYPHVLLDAAKANPAAYGRYLQAFSPQYQSTTAVPVHVRG